MTTKSKTAREQIKETVKEVRAANAKAHEARLENCTAAAEARIRAVDRAGRLARWRGEAGR